MKLDLLTVRDWTVALVDEAAHRAVSLLNAGTQTHFKADGTIVTDVDRSTEQFLRAAIEKEFPDHALLGEEYGLEGKAGNVPLWAIDPIDGTVNFANGLPFWCLSVGLIVEGRPALGIIHAPQVGQVFVGGEGMGVTLNGRPLPSLSPGRPLVWEDTYGICSNSARQVDFTEVPCRVRATGSAALDLAYAAAGWTKGCQSIGTSLWDVAAGIALCNAAGAVAQWHTGQAWTVENMLSGEHRTDILLTAPEDTVAFLRRNLRLR